MAEVIPFRGILYNPEKIDDLSCVATPPYDVISEKEQRGYYECHPCNPIRLVLGLRYEDDNDENNRHTRAAEFFNQWVSDCMLTRDDRPAIYLTAVDFPYEGETVTRYGMIMLVRLEPFEKKIVLPHEKTFSKVKSERLKLMKAGQANFCPIFSLYSDTDNILETLKNSINGKSPASDFVDDTGQRQRLWRIADAEEHRLVTESMKDKRIFIADGHHRYETALAYRKWLKENTPDFSPEHPANYVMMYLSSMEDPGLVIRPAHRLLKGIPESALAGFEEKAEQYFTVEKYPFDSDSYEKVRGEAIARLKAGGSTNTYCVFMKNRSEFLLLTIKPGVMKQVFGEEIPPSMIELDVTVLTRLILMRILGFDKERLDNEKLIGYSSVAEQAIDNVRKNGFDMAFVINPTKIEQVREIAAEGLVMPRKSTYFYPKVITGQVMNKLTNN